ncbi:hypothetical protein [Pseudomonas sp. EggHat1]|uniref:hypothetical protein n=1 Tax=Pseudomonas sp. EggHat1 TaxID=2761624 RepID=UPI0018679305|nr:hypothetical protein [Pseudomonas sp. EggHat1]
MSRSLLLLLTFSLTGCAYHSPYIDPTAGSDGVSAKTHSANQQKKLVEEANALSNANLYATSLLAGTLGFGAYKVLTGGGEHQIAALATGSGVIYGYQQALYNETVAGILLDAASNLSCIDSIYTMPSTERGTIIKEKIIKISEKVWDSLEAPYITAVDKILASEKQYKANINRVVHTANKKRANLQLSPAQSYALIASSINSSSPAIMPDAQALQTTVNLAAQTGEKDNVGAFVINQSVKAELLTLIANLSEWIDDVNKAASDFNPDNLAECRSTNSPPTLYGLDLTTTTEIEAGKTYSYKIANSSGNLSASSNQKDSAGKNYISTAIRTDSGSYFLEVTGEVDSKSTPVTVYLTDVGKDEATRVIKFVVKAPQ